MAFKYFNVKNGLTTGNIELHAANGNVQANTFLGNINVTSSANLGSVSNLVITGGSANYVLSTDGAGNLNWVAQSGGSSGNLEAYSDTFTGNGVQNTFTLSTTPSNINLVTVNYNGEILLRDSYSLDGANLIFTEAPANTAEIEVTTLSGGGGGGGGGTPGGSNTQVQFNDAGSFGGNAGFTFNKTTTTLTANNFVATSTANLGNVANVVITGGTNGQVLATNGSGGLSWVSVGTASIISNGNSNVNIATANGNITLSAAGNANVLVVSGASANVTGVANVTGDIVGGGNLSIAGNALVSGNLTVDGSLIYVNVTDLAVEDPIIQLQTGPNGAPLTSNTGKDVGTALNYYDTSAKIAWMGWDTSNAEIAFGANVGISSEVVSFTALANIRSGNAQLGNLATANFFSGTLTTAAQPNITSIGTLSSLTVTGNVSAGNFVGNLANGNSDISIPAANGNINFDVAGNANVTVFTGTGINVAGTGNFTGNLTAANLVSTRVVTRVANNGATTSGNISPNADTSDQFNIVGLTGTSNIEIPTGTFLDGQKLLLKIKDNGTSRTLNWNTAGANSYRPIGVTLPATTTANKVTYVGCVYNSSDVFWDVLAVGTQA